MPTLVQLALQRQTGNKQTSTRAASSKNEYEEFEASQRVGCGSTQCRCLRRLKCGQNEPKMASGDPELTSDHSLWCQNRDFRLFSFSRSSDDRDRYGELLVRSGHVFPVILPQEASKTVQKWLLELHFSDLPSQASRVSSDLPSQASKLPLFLGGIWVPGGRPLGGGGGSNSQFCSTIRNMSVGRFQLALRALDLRAAPCPRGLVRPSGSLAGDPTLWGLNPP